MKVLAFCSVLFLAGAELAAGFSSSFSPFALKRANSIGCAFSKGHPAITARALTKIPLRMTQGAPGPDDGEEIVQISEEELRALVEQAGGTLEVRDPSTVRRKRVAEEPNPVLTGLAGAFEPILKLPAVLSYPLIILIVGGVSAIFLPLFGSGSIGSMTGRVAETAPPPETADKPQFAVTACDETCVAKKKMARSCDIFPYSLTPTCSDPDIGNKGILKNLDKYTQPPPSVVKERAAAAAAAAAAAGQEAGN